MLKKKPLRLSVVALAAFPLVLACSDGMHPGSQAAPEDEWAQLPGIRELMALPPEAFPPELREAHVETVRLMKESGFRVLSPLEERVELHSLRPEGMPPGILKAREAAVQELGEDWGSLEDIMALPPEAFPPELREAHEDAVKLMTSSDLRALSAGEERAELLALDPEDLPADVRRAREAAVLGEYGAQPSSGIGVAADDGESGCWLEANAGHREWRRWTRCVHGPRYACSRRDGEYDQHAHYGPFWRGMHAVCWW